MGLVIIIIIIIMELLMLVVLNKGPGNRDTLHAGFGRFSPLVGGDDHWSPCSPGSLVKLGSRPVSVPAIADYW